MRSVIIIIVIIICTAIASLAFADQLTLSTKYYLTAAKRMGNTTLAELGYEREIGKGFSLETGIGYAQFEAKDVTDTELEYLNLITTKIGTKYNLWKWVYLKAGLRLNEFYMSVTDISPEFGAYAGIEISTKDNPAFYIDVTQEYGDLKIEYPIMEDRTTMQGWLIGAGLKYKF